jgi:hypothetical protein
MSRTSAERRSGPVLPDARTFPDDDPYSGLENTFGLFEHGERAHFRCRGPRPASQRTSPVEPGHSGQTGQATKTPFRLGEDLSTPDVLFRDVLQVRLSEGSR